jgi:hypothetical protein
VNLLQQARNAVFGETWALPVGVALLLGAAVAIKLAAPDLWQDLGGPLLLVGASVVLVALVERGRGDG